jgi:hypothetical protein
MEEDWSQAIRNSEFSWSENDVTIVEYNVTSTENVITLPEEILRDTDHEVVDVFEVYVCDISQVS